jgi:polysaccharide pyruvyl transferase WcaK-like protein
MAALGAADGSDEVYPDLAFALEPPPARGHTGTICVAVGVMAYSGWIRRHEDGTAIYAAYLDKIEAFVRWLLSAGHDVRLITGDRQDGEAICEIVTRLKLRPQPGATGRIRVRPTHALREVMDEIALSDIVVATRFHNIVAALKLARPTISLGYAEKNEALLRDVGLEGFSQHVEHFDLDLLRSQFARALAERNAISRRIAEMTGRYGARLAAQGQVLLRLLPPDDSVKPVSVHPAPAAR